MRFVSTLGGTELEESGGGDLRFDARVECELLATENVRAANDLVISQT